MRGRGQGTKRKELPKGSHITIDQLGAKRRVLILCVISYLKNVGRRSGEKRGKRERETRVFHEGNCRQINKEKGGASWRTMRLFVGEKKGSGGEVSKQVFPSAQLREGEGQNPYNMSETTGN